MSDSFLVTKKKQGFQIKGNLDERINVSLLLEQLPFQGVIRPPLEFDFGGVQRCNSAGLVEWLKYVQSINIPFMYSHCPPWMVGHFNSISQFFPHQIAGVESFYAPFYCEADNENKNILYVVGKDIKLEDDFSTLKIEPRTIDGKVFVADFEPSRYFQFLTKNQKSFKEFFNQIRHK